MSPRLKRLSGHKVIKIFESLGFYIFSQNGSHVKLRKIDNDGKKTDSYDSIT